MTPIEKIEHLLHLHACEQEGITSGQPTAQEWLTAVKEASEAVQEIKYHIGQFEKEATEYAKWLESRLTEKNEIIEQLEFQLRQKLIS